MDKDDHNDSNLKFSHKERELLLQLVEEHKDVVENIMKDSVSVFRRNNAWRQIANNFSELCRIYKINVYRTASQLGRCWRNLKYRCRKSDSEEKQHLLKTGGGPPFVKIVEDEFYNDKVRSIVPTIDFTLENSYDSTSALESNNVDESDFLEAIPRKGYFKNDVYEKENFNDEIEDKNNYKNHTSKAISNIAIPLATGYSNTEDTGSILQNRLNNCKGLIKKQEAQKKSAQNIPMGFEYEQEARLTKIHHSVMQQNDVHKKKLKILEKEYNYWEEMIDTLDLKKDVYRNEKKVMQLQIKFWDAKISAFNSRLED